MRVETAVEFRMFLQVLSELEDDEEEIVRRKLDPPGSLVRVSKIQQNYREVPWFQRVRAKFLMGLGAFLLSVFVAVTHFLLLLLPPWD